VAAQKHEDVEPLQRIHQAGGDIDIVLEAVAIVDVEGEQLAGHQGAGQPTISGWVNRPEAMQASMASLVGSRISACGSKGLASRQCLRAGRPFLPAAAIIVRAGGVQSIGVPSQCLGFIDRALHVITE